MKKSNRIVVISLVSILLVSLLFIVILREKKTGKDEKQNAPQREVDILYNQYITDTENKEKELISRGNKGRI